MDLPLETLARRSTGIVERVYTSARYGYILADTGERLFFQRSNVMGYGHTWTPRPGAAVRFNRLLCRRGLQALKVRPRRCPW